MKRGIAAFAFSVAVPATAHAHLVQTGFGTFYDGINHLLITPSDLLLVIALALFAGLNGRTSSRIVLVGLPLAWLVGGVAGMLVATESTLPWMTTLSFGLAGGLVAANVKLREMSVAVLAVSLGLVHGFVNGASMTPGGDDWLALAGATAATFAFATVLSAIVVSLKRDWQRIAVRVAGSWMVAICLLMFGWLWKGSAVQ